MLMVGGGIDISFMSLELNHRVDLARQSVPGTNLTFAQIGVPPRTDFADLNFKKDQSVQAGFHLGALLTVSEQLAVGVRYLSRQKIEVTDGELSTRQIETGLRVPPPGLPGLPPGAPLDTALAARFAPNAQLADGQVVTTSLYLPDQFVAGIMVRPTGSVKVKIDYQFTNWSLFDELTVDAENGLNLTLDQAFENTHGVRVGTEYALTPVTAIRAGFLMHTAASPEDTATPLLPEGPRAEFTAGVGRQLTNGVTVDLAYQFLQQADQRGRTILNPGVRPADLNSGIYEFGAHLFGANVSVQW
jgi:long-chain fatty acid transport protein